MTDDVLKTVFLDAPCEERQQLLVLPCEVAKGFPKDWLVEINQIDVAVLELEFVKPTAAIKNKRYKIVHHHGSAWISLPRGWLRDQQHQLGDMLDIVKRPEPNKLHVVFRRKE